MVSEEFNRSLIAKEISHAQFLANQEWLFYEFMLSCLVSNIVDKTSSIASYLIDRNGDIRIKAATLDDSSSISDALKDLISWFFSMLFSDSYTFSSHE